MLTRLYGSTRLATTNETHDLSQGCQQPAATKFSAGSGADYKKKLSCLLLHSN